jgi:LCP family protein required for cell wall assembly
VRAGDPLERTPRRHPGPGRAVPPGAPGEPRPRPGLPPRAPGLRVRRALTLLGLTLVAPGSAQSVAGNARAGRLALRIWTAYFALLVLVAVAWVVHRSSVIGLFTHPAVLRVLAIALIGTGIAWPLLVLDSWRLGEVRLLPVRSSRSLTAVAALLALVTFAVPVMAGRRVWAGATLIHSVFTSSTESAAADGRYNVLLLGGDAGPDRVGTRPDSMNLASIDAKTGRTVIFSLPRNLQNVPFLPGTPAAKAMPQGWSCGDVCLLNAIYTFGAQHPQYFPGVADPGAEAMEQAVQSVTGLKVNYYVMIDLAGFESLINAVGGIDIVATEKVPIGGETSKIHGYIEPGKQHLDGFHALWYARSRAATSDYDRMARQRCVMTAMVNQLSPAGLLEHFQSIAAASQKVVSTDIPASDLSTFVTLGQDAKQQKISSVQFVPPLITPKHPDFAVIRSTVAAAVSSSEHPAAAARSSPPAGSAGSGSTPSTKPSSTTGSAGTTTAGTASAQPVDVRQVCAPA